MDLVDYAIEAHKSAYAPYSKFKVGVAILGSDEKIYVGCNVENASFPEGTCAEASALSAMVIAGCTEIKKVVVYAEGKQITTPCGGCRQKISEFSEPDVVIVCVNSEGNKFAMTIQELLPGAFRAENLLE